MENGKWQKLLRCCIKRMSHNLKPFKPAIHYVCATLASDNNYLASQTQLVRPGQNVKAINYQIFAYIGVYIYTCEYIFN